MKTISIAIDGPSGAGKSTLARSIAAKLEYLYVDTGAIYRTIGLYALENGVDPKDEAAVTATLPNIQVGLEYGADGLQHMLLNGENVTERIRLPEMSAYASAVSAHPPVRAFLMDTQRNMAHTKNVIMDGRDIGTVVLPDAKLKIFLYASPECRARRRYDELKAKGMDVTYEDVLQDVIDRDYADSHRDIAPLKPAEDAVLVDTSGEDRETSFNRLIKIMREHI